MFTRLGLSRPGLSLKTTTYRKIKFINQDSFHSDIQAYSLCDDKQFDTADDSDAYMRVNTLPPYQHCLIDTRHLKHAEQLPDLTYPGTMKLSIMLSESVRKQNANGERQRLPIICLISSQRETTWPIWWIRLGGNSTLSLWLKTVHIKGSCLMLRKSFWAWRMNPCLPNNLTRP